MIFLLNTYLNKKKTFNHFLNMGFKKRVFFLNGGFPFLVSMELELQKSNKEAYLAPASDAPLSKHSGHY